MLFPGCPPMSLQQDCKRWIKYIKHVMSSGQLAKLSVCASVRQSVSFYTCLRVPSLPACLFASVEVCLSACQCLHVVLCAIYAACLNLLPSICARNVCLSACLSVSVSVYVIFCSFNPSFLPSFIHASMVRSFEPSKFTVRARAKGHRFLGPISMHRTQAGQLSERTNSIAIWWNGGICF